MKSRYALLGLLCILLASPAFGAVYTASDSPGPGEFATIQEAVDMCSPTDSVEIVGDFIESVVITTASLTIFGDGDVSGSPAFDLAASADNTTIDGLLIDGIHITAGSNGNNIVNNCFYAGIVEDDCITLLINNWSGNSFWDFLGNTGFPTKYNVAVGNQVDYMVGNAGAAYVDPVGPDPAELLWGTDVDYSLEFTFDVNCLSAGTCAKIV